MAAASSTPAVLSLQQASFAAEHRRSAAAAHLDLELQRGETALIEVPDDDVAAALVDLCFGRSDPEAGAVAFMGVDWRALPERERLGRRRRISLVGGTGVWPAHLTVAEGVVLPRLYRTEQSREEVMADATALARKFGLPGLPIDRSETTARRSLVRAACVRGFLGTAELTVIQDSVLDEAAELATPLAQAVASVRERGGTTLWIAENLGAPGVRFVQADRVLRLGDRGFVAARRPT